jgi:hypothetical protein
MLTVPVVVVEAQWLVDVFPPSTGISSPLM